MTPADTETRLARAVAACDAAGLRLTPPRRDVLALLLASDEPLTAYALLDRLRDRRGAVTPPTVYRALEFLTAHGLAHRIEHRNAYIACAEEPHHDHHHAPAFLICTRCGAAVEIDDPAIFAAARRAAARAGFTPATITVEAEGTCAACAAKAVSDSVRAEG